MDIGSLTGQVAIEDQVSDVLSHVVHSVKDFINEFEGLLGTATLVGGAIVAAVAGAVISIEELGKKGSVILGVEEAFDRLAKQAGTTGDALRSGLSEGVKHTVDELTLMETTSKLLSSGVKVTADQLKLMGEAARAMGKATGGDATSGLNTLSSAMLTGNERALKRAGIIPNVAKAEADLAKALGTTTDQLSRAGILEAKRTAILDATRVYVDRLGVSELSLKERFQQVSVATEEWFAKLEKGIASSPHVMAAFDAISDSIKKAFGGSSQTLLEILLKWVDDFADAVAKWGPIIIQWMVDIKDGIQKIWMEAKAGWEWLPEWFKAMAKDAALAGGSIFVVKEAISGIGGSDVLGTLSDLAQIWSVVGGNIAKAATAAKEWVLIVAVFKWEGVTLAVQTLAGAFASLAASMAPFAVPAILLTVASAFADIAKEIRGAYTAWVEGKSLWDIFFTRKEAIVVTDPFMILTSGLRKWVDEAITGAGKVKAAIKNVGDIELIKPVGQVSGHGIEEASAPGPNLLKGVDAKAMEAATATSISKTAQLWDEYFALIEKDTGQELAAQLSAIDRWLTSEITALDKSKKNNEDYWNQREAIESVYWQKRMDAEIQYSLATIQLSESTTESAVAAIAKGLQGQPNVLADMARTTATFTDEMNTAKDAVHNLVSGSMLLGKSWVGIGSLINTAVDGFNSKFVIAMNAARQAAKPLEDWQKQAIKDMKALGLSSEEMAAILEVSLKKVDGALGTTLDKLGTMISALSNSLTQLAQVSGDSFGGIIRDVAQIAVAGERAIQSVQAYRAAGNSKTGKAVAIAGEGMSAVGTFQQIQSGNMGAAAGIGSMALSGASIGTMILPGWGTAIGAGVGALVGVIAWAFRDKRLQDIARDAGKDFGTTFSKETAEAIKKTSKEGGFSLPAAELVHLQEIIADAGGLSADNLPKLTARLRDVFSMIETHQFTIAQGAALIDQNWQAFVDAATDSAGFLAANVKELIALDAQFGTHSKAIKDYLLGQSGAALDAVNAIVAGASQAFDGWDAIKQRVDDTTSAVQKLHSSTVDVNAVIEKMGASEKAALTSGYAAAQASGFKGDLEAFFQQQAALYKFAKEGDPRLQTWFSGDTLKRFADQQKAASDAVTTVIGHMRGGELDALNQGFVQALQDGFKGTLSDFLLQQNQLYLVAQEGDKRLKTWLSGQTVSELNAIPAIQAYNEALKAQQDAAAAAKDELNNLGFIAVTAFDAAIKSGMSISDAILKIHPALSAIRKGFKDLGIDVESVALKSMLMMDAIYEKYPDLATGLSGLTALLPALSNLSALTPDAFAGVEQAGRQQFVRVQSAVASQGGTNTDALRIMQPFLHQAEAAAKTLGIEVDDFTKMLIQQSKDAGIWQEAAKSAQDLNTTALGGLTDAVNDNTRALRGEAPPTEPIDRTGGVRNPPPPGTPVNTVPTGPRAPGPEASSHTESTVIIPIIVPPGLSPDDMASYVSSRLPPELQKNTGGQRSQLKKAIGMSVTTWAKPAA